MLKQRYGRHHRTYTGHRSRGASGRCIKCTSFLSRVSKLPPEIKQMIFGRYRVGLRKRIVARKNRVVNVKKRFKR